MLGYVTDPTAPGGLALRDLDEPEPTTDQVVVQVQAFAVNRGELRLLADRPDGWRPGQDLAGVVKARAPDGSGPDPGTRVVGLAEGGGWSQVAVVDSHAVAPIPDAVSFEDAAALPVAGLTALRALRTGGALIGRHVLVTGATGGVGSFAVQLAAAAGAHLTALVSSPARVSAAQNLGAHAVVTDLRDVATPFDLALDGVGGPVLADAIHHLAPGATLTAYGVAGGGGSTPLAFFDFARAPLARLTGFFLYATDPQSFGADLAVLGGFVADGRLRVVRETRSWRETPESIQALRDRQVTGKLVLTVKH